MKFAIALISGLINFLIAAFFGYFVLPLGLMGASSEKAVNLSFILFIVWSVVGSILAMIFSFLAAYYLIEKRNFGNASAFFIPILAFAIVSVIFNTIAWILATIIGNLKFN